MRDLENLRSRLAREETTLSAAHEQIEMGRRKIEALRQQIEDVKRQIEGAERQIEKLQDHSGTVEKRMALLREYIEMVEAGEEVIPSADATQPEVRAEEPQSAALPTLDAGEEEEEIDLEFVRPLSTHEETDPVPVDAEPISFENLDEELLTHEILPRTQTFGEELLLVLANHRRAVAPKDIGRIFRRLTYAPKLSPTAKNVRSEVETDQHIFEYAGGDKVALTREGRQEAQQLLRQLYGAG
ncbi:MAG: hypothetical protein V3U13_09450 [Gemmatimonadota bacterium]|jgi:hypothetical protein